MLVYYVSAVVQFNLIFMKNINFLNFPFRITGLVLKMGRKPLRHQVRELMQKTAHFNGSNPKHSATFFFLSKHACFAVIFMGEVWISAKIWCLSRRLLGLLLKEQ